MEVHEQCLTAMTLPHYFVTNVQKYANIEYSITKVELEEHLLQELYQVGHMSAWHHLCLEGVHLQRRASIGQGKDAQNYLHLFLWAELKTDVTLECDMSLPHMVHLLVTTLVEYAGST